MASETETREPPAGAGVARARDSGQAERVTLTLSGRDLRSSAGHPTAPQSNPANRLTIIQCNITRAGGRADWWCLVTAVPVQGRATDSAVTAKRVT